METNQHNHEAQGFQLWLRMPLSYKMLGARKTLWEAPLPPSHA